MTRHLEKEIELLKKAVLELATAVEEDLDRAIMAVMERNSKEAEAVVKRDDEIDEMELRLEEECLKILALYQPVAIDLRYIIAVLKVNNDLERIGDLATNLAQRALSLATLERVQFPPMFGEITRKVQRMVRECLDALVTRDAHLALKVIHEDAAVDDLHRKLIEWTEQAILNDVTRTSPYMHIVSASKYLERVADQATNIAEDVVYLVTGDIIRHHVSEYRFASGKG